MSIDNKVKSYKLLEELFNYLFSNIKLLNYSISDL